VIAQLIGAGGLIRIIFGLDYILAIVIVGGLMLIYVLLGGMIATTWVQIIKAVLLLAAGVALFLLVIRQYGFNLTGPMRASAERYGDAVHRGG